MKTVLHVWSDKTDLRPYAVRSKLPLERFAAARSGMAYRRLLRFKCIVSTKGTEDINGRVSDINAFCQQHQEELKRLVTDARIGGVFIDVPYHYARSAGGSIFEPYIKAEMLSVVKVIGVGVQMTLVKETEPNQ